MKQSLILGSNNTYSGQKSGQQRAAVNPKAKDLSFKIDLAGQAHRAPAPRPMLKRAHRGQRFLGQIREVITTQNFTLTCLKVSFQGGEPTCLYNKRCGDPEDSAISSLNRRRRPNPRPLAARKGFWKF